MSRSTLRSLALVTLAFVSTGFAAPVAVANAPNAAAPAVDKQLVLAYDSCDCQTLHGNEIRLAFDSDTTIPEYKQSLYVHDYAAAFSAYEFDHLGRVTCAGEFYGYLEYGCHDVEKAYYNNIKCIRPVPEGWLDKSDYAPQKEVYDHKESYATEHGFDSYDKLDDIDNYYGEDNYGTYGKDSNGAEKQYATQHLWDSDSEWDSDDDFTYGQNKPGYGASYDNDYAHEEYNAPYDGEYSSPAYGPEGYDVPQAYKPYQDYDVDVPGYDVPAAQGYDVPAPQGYDVPYEYNAPEGYNHPYEYSAPEDYGYDVPAAQGYDAPYEHKSPEGYGAPYDVDYSDAEYSDAEYSGSQYSDVEFFYSDAEDSEFESDSDDELYYGSTYTPKKENNVNKGWRPINKEAEIPAIGYSDDSDSDDELYYGPAYAPKKENNVNKGWKKINKGESTKKNKTAHSKNNKGFSYPYGNQEYSYESDSDSDSDGYESEVEVAYPEVPPSPGWKKIDSEADSRDEGYAAGHGHGGYAKGEKLEEYDDSYKSYGSPYNGTDSTNPRFSHVSPPQHEGQGYPAPKDSLPFHKKPEEPESYAKEEYGDFSDSAAASA